jgi:Fe-S oxidoreductase
LVPGLANAALQWRSVRMLLERFVGISAGRPLPRFAPQRFDLWFSGRGGSPPGQRGRVILWDDTFTRYHEPHIGQAAVAVLEAAGFQVLLPRGRQCCGRPAFSQGNLTEAAWLGRHNLRLLTSQTELAEAPVLFLEPSCWSMFVEDYRELGLPGAEKVASRCWLFEQFMEELLDREPTALSFRAQTGHVAIHAHCHTKALLDPKFLVRLAGRLPGRTVRLLETGCCGMAGAFGAMTHTYELSVQVGRLMQEQIAALDRDAVLVASGTSCRQQILHLCQRQPLHMAQLLAEALNHRPAH